MNTKDSLAQIRLDERQHVEKPLRDQLAGLGWEIISRQFFILPQEALWQRKWRLYKSGRCDFFKL